MKRCFCLCFGLLLLGCEGETDSSWVAPANYTNQFTKREEPLDARRGQTLYVPIYSNILVGEGTRPTEMAATLAIRNTDLDHEIFITKVTYYDSAGKLIETYAHPYVYLSAEATGETGVNRAQLEEAVAGDRGVFRELQPDGRRCQRLCPRDLRQGTRRLRGRSQAPQS